MERKKIRGILVAGFLLLFAQNITAVHPNHQCAAGGKGLILPTAEEKNKMEKKWKVEKVHSNKIGAARIRAAKEKAGRPVPVFFIAKSHDEEFNGSGTPVETAALPRSVNNSTLPSFPPIGDQGQIGSCVAWATTYYQATHEIGLLNGMNNKNSFQNVLSPKWTYNMINGGMDSGSMITDAYAVLAQNGAASLANFPYDTDFLAWDLNSQDWLQAISNRMAAPKALDGVNSSPQNLTSIKQALANGHVLTFCTYIDSWQYTMIQSDPNSDNSYVGQYAASWVNGTDGGHCMTIVGYDDDLWIDVNGNGQVDSGEKGAFLVANSWTPSWGNSGFIWIAYDAFLTRSAVKGGPMDGRVPAADATNSYLILSHPKAPHYSPSLVAEFDISQAQRNQIKIGAAVSAASQNSPTKYFQSGAISFQGGPYSFSGAAPTLLEMGTFYLDLSDLASFGGPQKFYFMVRDDVTNVPTALNSLALLDMHSGTKAIGMMQKIENGKITQPVEFTLSEAAQARPLSVQVVTPVDGEAVKGVIPVIAKPTNPNDRVEFYVNSNQVAVHEEAPYFVLLDTAKFSKGRTLISVIAYDKNNSYSTKHVRIYIQNE